MLSLFSGNITLHQCFPTLKLLTGEKKEGKLYDKRLIATPSITILLGDLV